MIAKLRAALQRARARLWELMASAREGMILLQIAPASR